MQKTNTVSLQTRNNWLLDAGLLLSGLLALLTGIYFLYLPTYGYAGGRNPAFNRYLLFDRQTWDDLHTWGGLAMILIATVHLAWHWSWVVNMARRVINELSGKCGCMNARGRWNLILNAIVAISFLIAAVSGLYFLLFVPVHGSAYAPGILFSNSTWDVIHTWSGVIFALGAMVHFGIHWKWVTMVTRKVVEQPLQTVGQVR